MTVPPTVEAVAGWKCCPRCRGLIPGGLAAVWSELLGAAVSTAEMEAMGGRGVGNPALFVIGWPTAEGSPDPWAHVGPAAIESARTALVEVRRERAVAAAPRRSSTGMGCAWCGVSRSTRWVASPWRWGGDRAGERMSACAECEPWIARSGVRTYVETEWRTFLLAACVGMRRAQMDTHFGLRAFFESGHADPAGTDTPWAYLGGVRDSVRWRVVRTHPRLLTLTDRERRILRLEAVDTDPPPRPPLAQL